MDIFALLEDATIEDKKQQIERAKKWIEDNPDDPENDELYELIDRLEKEIDGQDGSSHDLDEMLDEARKIVRGVLPEMYHVNLSDENRPIIQWGDTGAHSLGKCSYNTNPCTITISNHLKNMDKNMVMNTVIHELIHALPICRYSGHTGNFKAIAHLVTSKTPYRIDTHADNNESKIFNDFASTGRNHYKVTCKNCGRESTFYKRARIIDHPENFHCRRCGASNYKIEYIPAEGASRVIKEANETVISDLIRFENSELKDALEEKFPGSTVNFWVTGSPMFWKSKVPVLVALEDKNKVINVLADIFGVTKDDVKFKGYEPTKAYTNEVNPVNGYRSYKTVNRLIFDVDWENTTNETLQKYQEYIRNSMKSQDIDWDETLTEGVNKPIQDRIGNFILETLVDRRYGNAKFTDIADVEVGPDYVDIAFDFDFKETLSYSGLSNKPKKIIHPTPTEIEVTEKHIDRFMTEELPQLFFRYYHVTPFFRITRDEHRWIDDRALACFYNIEQLNERK